MQQTYPTEQSGGTATVRCGKLSFLVFHSTLLATSWLSSVLMQGSCSCILGGFTSNKERTAGYFVSVRHTKVAGAAQMLPRLQCGGTDGSVGNGASIYFASHGRQSPPWNGFLLLLSITSTLILQALVLHPFPLRTLSNRRRWNYGISLLDRVQVEGNNNISFTYAAAVQSNSDQEIVPTPHPQFIWLSSSKKSGRRAEVAVHSPRWEGYRMPAGVPDHPQPQRRPRSSPVGIPGCWEE